MMNRFGAMWVFAGLLLVLQFPTLADDHAFYSRFSVSKDRVDEGYPKVPSRDGWFGLWKQGVDAVLRHPTNGKVYFFKGGEYARYDLQRDRVDPGYPKKIGVDGWFGVWQTGIDAALVHPRNGKAYFFRGSEYQRYDLTTDRVEPGYPKRIDGDGWFGLRFARLDAALPHPTNGKIYFFSGAQYARFDLKKDRVDPGYPKGTAIAGWAGLRTPTTAAVGLDDERLYFFHPAGFGKHQKHWAVFNRPDGKGRTDDAIHAAIMHRIRNAKVGSSISVSIAGWDRTDFVDVLADAVDRGVDVKVVAQKSSGDSWFGVKSAVQQRLRSRGIEGKVREWKRSSNSAGVQNINHAKFILFSELDGVYAERHVVGISSSNWRAMDLRRQNDLMLVADKTQYDAFHGYFSAIWNAAGKENTDRAVFGSVQKSPGDALMSYFHPEIDEVTSGNPLHDPVLELLTGIQCEPSQRIWVAGSTWGSRGRGGRIMSRLEALKKAGCDVRILGEHVKSNPETTKKIFDRAAAALIPWGKTSTHNKYIVLDADFGDGRHRRKVLAGNLNFGSPLEAKHNGMLDVTLVARGNIFFVNYLNHWLWLCGTAFETSPGACQK